MVQLCQRLRPKCGNVTGMQFDEDLKDKANFGFELAFTVD